jgi:hypothetical protein
VENAAKPMNTHLLPDVRLAHLELAAALQQSSLAAAARNPCSTAALTRQACCFADRPMGSSKIFAGTRDQVSAVRRFARSELGDHRAVDEAVLVASELATNAITHSASGHDGGMFMVHLTAISADHVAILVTDQGGQGEPAAQHAGPDAESGRGLDIVMSIASLFIPFGDDTMRTIVAMVGPDAGAERPARLALRVVSQLSAVYGRSGRAGLPLSRSIYAERTWRAAQLPGR